MAIILYQLGINKEFWAGSKLVWHFPCVRHILNYIINIHDTYLHPYLRAIETGGFNLNYWWIIPIQPQVHCACCCSACDLIEHSSDISWSGGAYSEWFQVVQMFPKVSKLCDCFEDFVAPEMPPLATHHYWSSIWPWLVTWSCWKLEAGGIDMFVLKEHLPWNLRESFWTCSYIWTILSKGDEVNLISLPWDILRWLQCIFAMLCGIRELTQTC